TQTSMLEIDKELERSMVISGFSKAYSMTGWRLGYSVANEETINNMVRIQQNTTSCATSFVQAAGVEALNGDQSFITMVQKEYQKRRDRITQLFKEMAQIPCIDPSGAFYVFPDFSEFGLSSNTLAELLLKKTGVVSTPGNVFGDHYDNHLRFSYATSLDVIEEGLLKLTEFLPTL
ncbi:MAG: aminotransferase class I/II-fold pyridoxal phosphate-dependent enzyme, partial [Candidatus Thorarchaeota archaeon]